MSFMVGKVYLEFTVNNDAFDIQKRRRFKQCHQIFHSAKLLNYGDIKFRANMRPPELDH